MNKVWLAFYTVLYGLLGVSGFVWGAQHADPTSGGPAAAAGVVWMFIGIAIAYVAFLFWTDPEYGLNGEVDY